jgi:hypothetical protein
MTQEPESDPELYWDRFIQYLGEKYPLGSKKEPMEYLNLMGSIEKFKKIYMEANDGKS